jgi:hypothetical protein
MPAETKHQAICHCSDCRRHAGAPFVSWALVDKAAMKIEGETHENASSKNGRRHFCPKCGTSLFYTNDVIFPGMIDVQTGTLDDPDELPPQVQVQAAERVGWLERLNDVPAFERYPG